MEKEITRKQFNLLEGFYLYRTGIEFFNGKKLSDGTTRDVAKSNSDWAWLLDNAGISWSLQNKIADLAEKKDLLGKNFSTIIRGLGITVGPWIIQNPKEETPEQKLQYQARVRGAIDWKYKVSRREKESYKKFRAFVGGSTGR